MKNIFFLIFVGFASLCAQETVQDTSYWNKKGKFTL
jgi:hypothetical protein